jgi:hypothetical protein
MFILTAQRDAELMMTCVRLINKLQKEEYYDEMYEHRPLTLETSKQVSS